MDWEEELYSGDKLLGKFKDAGRACGENEGVLLDENSLPLLRLENYDDRETQVYK
jgi:hypothetical protein